MTRRSILSAILLAAACWQSAAADPALENAIRPFVRGSFSAILEAGRGRPHIINFWSIGCPPCLAEMPVLTRILKDRADIRLTMVSTDSAGDISRILRTLKKYAPANSENWVFADTFTERLRYEVDKSWNGELPRTYLIGADGEITMKSGLVHESAIKKWLKGQER